MVSGASVDWDDTGPLEMTVDASVDEVVREVSVGSMLGTELLDEVGDVTVRAVSSGLTGVTVDMAEPVLLLTETVEPSVGIVLGEPMDVTVGKRQVEVLWKVVDCPLFSVVRVLSQGKVVVLNPGLLGKLEDPPRTVVWEVPVGNVPMLLWKVVESVETTMVGEL